MIELVSQGVIINQGSCISFLGNGQQIDVMYTNKKDEYCKTKLTPESLADILFEFSVAGQKSGLNNIVNF
jgi:hypothetical protein